MMSSERLPDPILITGAARSGTSLVAGSVKLCGAFGGILAGPSKYNALGMYENFRIRNTITKPYLRGLGLDALGQYPLPVVDGLPIPTDWRYRIEQVMREEGYPGGPWFYKGAKMCLFWPVWNYAFPRAKWVIVRRRTGDIVSSCCKTPFMQAFRHRSFQRAVGAQDERGGWIWWVRQHEARFVEMIQAGLNAKVIWPERMISGDYSQIMETIEWLGLKWNSEVLNFIDPKLWKARRK